MLRVADQLQAHREELAGLVTLEVGKRTAECLAEIDKSAQLIRYYAQLAPELLASLEIPTQASRSGVAFEALGTVLAVMPWNYPIWQVLRFAVPALMAGNACLVKPAPSVPQSTQRLLELARAAGLETLEVAWIDHDQVEEAIRQCDAVAFTGSTQTGRAIAALAGRHLKKTVLELGGSNPFIVLADADVAAAAQDAANSRFRDAGQSCNAAKRMIVVPEIADAFIAAFCAEAAKLRAGDPRHPATTLSPLTRADLRGPYTPRCWTPSPTAPSCAWAARCRSRPASSTGHGAGPGQSGLPRLPRGSIRPGGQHLARATRPTRCAWPTTLRSAWAPASTARTRNALGRWRARSRPAACSSIATPARTCACLSAASNPRAMAASCRVRLVRVRQRQDLLAK